MRGVFVRASSVLHATKDCIPDFIIFSPEATSLSLSILVSCLSRFSLIFPLVVLSLSYNTQLMPLLSPGTDDSTSCTSDTHSPS